MKDDNRERFLGWQSYGYQGQTCVCPSVLTLTTGKDISSNSEANASELLEMFFATESSGVDHE